MYRLKYPYLYAYVTFTLHYTDNHPTSHSSTLLSLGHASLPMIGINRQLVTNEPVELRKNRLKFKTSRKLPIVLEEFVKYTPIYKGKPDDVNM